MFSKILASALVIFSILAGCSSPSGQSNATQSNSTSPDLEQTESAPKTSEVESLRIHDIVVSTTSGVEVNVTWIITGQPFDTWAELQQGNVTVASGWGGINRGNGSWENRIATAQGANYSVVVRARSEPGGAIFSEDGPSFYSGFQKLGLANIEAHATVNTFNPRVYIIAGIHWIAEGPPSTKTWMNYSYDLSYRWYTATKGGPGPSGYESIWESPDQVLHYRIYVEDGMGNQIDSGPLSLVIPSDPKSRYSNLRVENVTLDYYQSDEGPRRYKAKIFWDFDGQLDREYGCLEYGTDPWYGTTLCRVADEAGIPVILLDDTLFYYRVYRNGVSAPFSNQATFFLPGAT